MLLLRSHKWLGLKPLNRLLFSLFRQCPRISLLPPFILPAADPPSLPHTPSLRQVPWTRVQLTLVLGSLTPPLMDTVRVIRRWLLMNLVG